MSQSARSLLTVLAAVAAALSAANPVGMPGWLAIVVAGLSAGLAGVGILPPQWRVTVKSPTSATAFKGSSPAGVTTRQLPHDPNVRPRVDDRKKPSPMSRNGLLMAVAGVLAAFALWPSGAFAYLHADNCRGALGGGNGDNDVARYLNTLGWVDIRTYYWIDPGGVARYSDSKISVLMRVVHTSGFWHDEWGYCYGSDSNIVDNMPTPPSGWY